MEWIKTSDRLEGLFFEDTGRKKPDPKDYQFRVFGDRYDPFQNRMDSWFDAYVEWLENKVITLTP